jgi:hypothetical protein
MTPVEERINHRIIPGKAEMWLGRDDISWLVFCPESEISLEDITLIIATATATHRPGDFFHVLVDMRGLDSISPEAREYAAAGKLSEIYDRLAIIADAPATFLVANFFLKFHKPPRPTRIFRNETDALQWLRQA